MKTKQWLLLPWIIVAMPLPALAHGGGLNRDGCHTNRKTGDYHCHGGGGVRPLPDAYRPMDGVPPSDVVPHIKPGPRVFANCSEARAAWAAPIRRGDPGYGPHMDRDGDGVGCKPYRRR